MRSVRRLLTVAISAAAGLLMTALPAFAHVTVHGDAVAGEYTTLTFQVPCESAKAKTVAITVNFPQDHPFASVSVRKMPGWTATVTTSKLSTPIKDDDNLTVTQAVSSITWKADPSAELSLGEYAAFDVSVGPVPAVASLSFPAVQTYDDGSIINWNDPTPAGGEEPEHPAPTLQIQPATGTTAGTATPASTGTDTSAAASAPPTTVTVTAAAAPAPAAASSDGTARGLAVAGIVVGAIGILAAALAYRRRTTSTPR